MVRVGFGYDVHRLMTGSLGTLGLDATASACEEAIGAARTLGAEDREAPLAGVVDRERVAHVLTP